MIDEEALMAHAESMTSQPWWFLVEAEMRNDLVHRYVRFIFSEYEKDKYGWVTKNPPSVAEFARSYDSEY